MRPLGLFGKGIVCRMDMIHKAAAIAFKDNQFLMIRKRGKDILTSLGGKLEPGETEDQALHREIMEEAGIEARVIEKLGDFESKAAFDDAMLRLSVYHVELLGEPILQPEDEVEEFIWVGSDYQERDIKLTSIITDKVIPLCQERGLLHWS